MKIALAYASVVFIWSTTPLAIKWSNSSLSFSAAVSARALFAALICAFLLLFLRRPLIKKRSDWMAYLAGLVGMFPNVLLVYWSARYIPSGLVAVIFGLYPFMVGVFSYWILKENIFNLKRVFALVFALFGLCVINLDQINMGEDALLGVMGIVASSALFGLSSVLVKRVGGEVDPLRQSSGTLFVSVPFLLISWWLMDGSLPSLIDQRSLIGVGYSAIAGSVLGGALFFYVLANCKMASVGLITFLTPILGIAVGVFVDGERFTPFTFVGSFIVIVALGVYQNVFKTVFLRFNKAV